MNGSLHFTFVIIIGLTSALVNLAIVDLGGNPTESNNIIDRYNDSDVINRYAGVLESDTGGVNPETGVFFNDPIGWITNIFNTLFVLIAAFIFPFNSILNMLGLPVAAVALINTAWALYGIVSLALLVGQR